MSIDEHPDPERRWKHRRRMAYAALIAGLLMPIIAIWADGIGALAGPYYLFVGAVVSVYIGSATMETVSTQKREQ